jgi:hypothetical protein
MSNINILLGIPSRGIVFTETLYSSLFELTNAGFPYNITFTQITPVDAARNNIWTQFVEGDYSHLVMMDDDVVMPALGIEKLLIANKGEISFFNYPEKITKKSCTRLNDDGSVATAPFGCAMFSREIVALLPKNPFSLMPQRMSKKHNGKWQFPEIEHAEKPNPWGGEDVNFCVIAARAGIRMHQVPEVATHLMYKPFQNEERAIQILTIERYESIEG